MTVKVDDHSGSMCRHLYDSMRAAQKPESKLKFVTLDKEKNISTLDKESYISTLCRREEFLKICSEDNLSEEAQEIEVTIPV